MDPDAPGTGRRGESGDRGGRVVPYRRGWWNSRPGGQEGAEKTLAGRADEQRVAEAAQLIEPREQRPVVGSRLGEAEARVEDQLVTLDTCREERCHPLAQLAGDVGHDIAVLVGRVARTAVVHRDVDNPGARDQAGHHGIGRARGDVVDDHGAVLEGRLCDRRPGRVDTHDHPGPGEPGHHRDDPVELLLSADPDGPGPGGLTADIDDVRAVGRQCEATRDGPVRAVPLTAVAERVGRDVEDPHHEATRDRGQRAGERSRTVVQRERGVHHLSLEIDPGQWPRMRLIASARVATSRICPRTADVTVRAPGLRTPRIDMHRCSHSITTITPRGDRAATSASATCEVKRSWTWGRRAYRSTSRATLLRPVMVPVAEGM